MITPGCVCRSHHCRSPHVAYIEQMFLTRLRQPHSGTSFGRANLALHPTDPPPSTQTMIQRSKHTPRSQQTTNRPQNTKAYWLQPRRLVRARSNRTIGKKPVRPFSYAPSTQSHTFHADLSNTSLSYIDIIFLFISWSTSL